MRSTFLSGQHPAILQIDSQTFSLKNIADEIWRDDENRAFRLFMLDRPDSNRISSHALIYSLIDFHDNKTPPLSCFKGSLTGGVIL